MGSTTEWVRRALDELGWDATDQEVKAYLREKGVPPGHIGLALKKLRARGIPSGRQPSRTQQPPASLSQGELFPE